MAENTDLYLRNIIFGMSDSLVSTIGLLSGIDASGVNHQSIIATGIIYAFVAAFSMAVGSFLSEQSAEQYKTRGEVVNTRALTGAVIMFVSFVGATFIPMIPYLVSNSELDLIFSILLAIVSLFVVGAISARMSGVSIIKHGFSMAGLGGLAIIIGVLVGKFVRVV